MSNNIYLHGDFATVEGDRFLADVDKDRAIINLEHETIILRAEHLDNIQAVLKLAEHFWRRAGISEGNAA